MEGAGVYDGGDTIPGECTLLPASVERLLTEAILIPEMLFL